MNQNLESTMEIRKPTWLKVSIGLMFLSAIITILAVFFLYIYPVLLVAPELVFMILPYTILDFGLAGLLIFSGLYLLTLSPGSFYFAEIILIIKTVIGFILSTSSIWNIINVLIIVLLYQNRLLFFDKAAYNSAHKEKTQTEIKPIAISSKLQDSIQFKEDSEISDSEILEEIKFCPNCGSSIPIKAKFCSYCGQKTS